MTIDDGGRLLPVPAPAVDVIDTTGAGDSFDAGFLRAWMDGAALTDCLRLGVACGSLSTRGLGGTATQPDLAEARAFLAARMRAAVLALLLTVALAGTAAAGDPPPAPTPSPIATTGARWRRRARTPGSSGR